MTVVPTDWYELLDKMTHQAAREFPGNANLTHHLAQAREALLCEIAAPVPEPEPEPEPEPARKLWNPLPALRGRPES